MKKIKNFSLLIFSALIFVCASVIFTGCKDDDYSKLYVFATTGGCVQVNDSTDYVEFGDEGSRVFKFKEDSSVKLKAIPQDGYSFVKWEYADELDEGRLELSTQPEITLFIDEDEIVVRAVFAVNGSTVYTITYPTNAEGYNVEVVSGYNTTVALGADFKFKVNLLSNYSNSQITVKANNTILTPSADGVYTIPAINENINITVTGVVENVVVTPSTYNIIANITGATVLPIGTTGFVVGSGESFTFTLQLSAGYKYSSGGIVVKANGVTIYGYDNYGTTYYTIANITQDTEIKVEGIELIENYTVTLPTGSNYKITQTNGSNFASTTIQVQKNEYLYFVVKPNTGVVVKTIAVLANGSILSPIAENTYRVQVATNMTIAVNITEEDSTTLTYTFNLDFRDEVKELLGNTVNQIPQSISFDIKETDKQTTYQASTFMVSTSMDVNKITIVELINRINGYLIQHSFDNGMKYFELNGTKFMELISSTDTLVINWTLLTTALEYPLIIVT